MFLNYLRKKICTNFSPEQFTSPRKKTNVNSDSERIPWIFCNTLESSICFGAGLVKKTKTKKPSYFLKQPKINSGFPILFLPHLAFLFHGNFLLIQLSHPISLISLSSSILTYNFSWTSRKLILPKFIVLFFSGHTQNSIYLNR